MFHFHARICNVFSTDDGISEALMRGADYAVVGAGSDERAAAGPQLRVRAIEGPLVPGTAIMPGVTGGSTSATTLMIGEHWAAMMRS